MSVISFYQEPKDLFLKLAREGRRAWITDSKEDSADHLFNYCITAHSLRDWCIKYLSIPKNEFHEVCNNYERLQWCRDIANSSKHFGLGTEKTSTVSKVNEIKDELVTITPDGQYSSNTQSRDSFIIEKPNGENELLMMFLFYSFSNWEEIFDKYQIPRYPDSLKTEMFIEFK